MSPEEQSPTEVESLRAISLDTHASAAVKPSSRPAGADAEPSVALPIRRTPLAAKLLFGAVVGGCVVVLALSVPSLRRDLAAKDARRAAAHASPASPPPAVVPPIATSTPIAAPPPSPALPAPREKDKLSSAAAAGPAPEEPTEARATAHEGVKPSKATIRLSKKAHALKVDGKPAKGGSVEVTCGPHQVAVDKDKPRLVDAVCGRTVVVDGKKAKVLPEGESVPAEIAGKETAGKPPPKIAGKRKGR